MNYLFAELVSLLVVVLGGTAIWARSRRPSTGSEWEALVARLAKVDRERLARIALSHPEAEIEAGTEYSEAEELSRLWFRDAGWKGLEDLQNNCAVMIDMAHHIQARYPEAVVVAEQLRLTARQVEWHLDRIRLASKAGHLELCIAEYGRQAVGLYYGMTETLKVLYQGLGAPEGVQLEALL